MSVTVEDLLKLPSMQGAEVVGGHRGLSKIVSSISVLETPDPKIFVDGFFPDNNFLGGEIVLTGFLNAQTDVDLQCRVVEELAAGGEIGLILYYVGLYMPSVDRRLIELADSLDFVLIRMPQRGATALRYSEVLTDVNERLFRDRAENTSFVAEIIERVSRLPSHLRTVGTVLEMLSDRITASVVLTDADHNILNLISWPRSLEETIKNKVEELKEYPTAGDGTPFSLSDNSYIYRLILEDDSPGSMELLVIKQDSNLEPQLLAQAGDIARIGLNLWGQGYSSVVVKELIRAIIQDDSIRMRRLGEIFHVDVASIHDMWILQSGAPDFQEKLARKKTELKEIIESFPFSSIHDFYEDTYLIFTQTPKHPSESENFGKALDDLLKSIDENFTLTHCSGKNNTAEVRKSYLTHKNYLSDAIQIFPLKRSFRYGEILFASECRALVENDKKETSRLKETLALLEGVSGEDITLPETLSVYLLDADSGITRTAELLFIHQNTVKYRLGRITELLGYKPNSMPESISLYRAVAVRRLVK